MARYAVFDDGRIVGFRDIADWDNYPAHKKAALDEKADSNPTLRPVIYEGKGKLETRIIEADRVRIVRSDPPVTALDIIRERQRRLAMGFGYDFGDARGVHQIGTTEDDLIGWRDVTDYANALIDSSDPATEIDIVTDTGPVAVTAPEWQAVMLRAAEVRQVLWAKSFALQKSLPTDYANDSHWTS